MEMVSLPVKEFNIKMREVMTGTKEGKKIIEEIVKNIKTDLKEEEFNESIDNDSKKELEELTKRIKEIQLQLDFYKKEYDKKAKELGVQNVPKKEYNWRDLADWHPSRRTPGE
jgi:hypothetical protein